MTMKATWVVIALLLGSQPTLSFACADGPDAYRVTGVAASDVLNVRSGPGTGFSIVGELPPNATGVRNLDRVPTNLCDELAGLTTFERRNIWVKIVWESDGPSVAGWVKARFLRE